MLTKPKGPGVLPLSPSMGSFIPNRIVGDPWLTSRWLASPSNVGPAESANRLVRFRTVR
jgi:hypothetical protein